jgi:hypothetical protein
MRRPTSYRGVLSMLEEFTGGSYESAVIADRFRLDRPPTLLARTASIAPIGFSRLKSDSATLARTKDVPAENAYLFHVQLRPVAVDMWIDGKLTPSTTKTSGTTFLYDLRTNPVAEIRSSFDNIRFYISQASLDELAFDQGIRPLTAHWCSSACPYLAKDEPKRASVFAGVICRALTVE